MRPTVGAGGGGQRVELVVFVDKRHRRRVVGQGVRVVAGVALHQVLITGLQTERVEQPRDSGARHAAPAVVGAVVEAEQDSHLGVACGGCGQTRANAGNRSGHRRGHRRVERNGR